MFNLSKLVKFWFLPVIIFSKCKSTSKTIGSFLFNLVKTEPGFFGISFSANTLERLPSKLIFGASLAIFITSFGGKVPYPGGGNYTNAKRGERGLIDTMRLEFPQYGIKITEICPATIDTQEQRREQALTADDLAESIYWVGSLPSHVNINQIEICHINSTKF